MVKEGSSNKALVSICRFFLKSGKCYKAKCKFSHKKNTEEKSEDLKEKGFGDCLDSANKQSEISEENLRKRQDDFASSNKALVSNDVKPTSICRFFLKSGKCYRAKCKFSHKINKEEKSEDLKEKGFDDCLDSANKQSEISEENLRKRQDDFDEFINSAKHSSKIGNIPSNWLKKCQPTYCGVCFISLNTHYMMETHYAGKPHKKKLKLAMGHPNNYTCSLCQVPTNSKRDAEIHRQGSKHTINVLLSQEVKTKQLYGKIRFSCDVCHVSTTNEDELKKHLVGKHHAKKLRSMTLIERNKTGFDCEVCGIKSIDYASLELHLEGPEHSVEVVKKEKKNKSGSEQTKAYIEKDLPLVPMDLKDTEKIEIMSNKRKIKVEVEETKKIKIEVYCILCQIYGHIVSEECVVRARCFNCGIKGHIRRDCLNNDNEYVEEIIPKDEPNNDVKLECDSDDTEIRKYMTTPFVCLFELNMNKECDENKKNIKFEVYCILCQMDGHISCEACVANAICSVCGIKGHVSRDCTEGKCEFKNVKLEVKKEI